MEYKKWAIVCIIGGVLVIISSVVGRIVFIDLINLISSSSSTVFVDPNAQLVFSFIAGGGGILVIIGALIAGFSSDFGGRLVIVLGIGASLVSLIVLIIPSIIGGTLTKNYFDLIPRHIFDEFYVSKLLPLILQSIFNEIYGLVGLTISFFTSRKLKD
ncbi:hypothetical protein LCGC14_0961600 [marine sediment metagenome]|uniref:Uncharacterized protein n=1 Tax=marine sediment metagenome TaxID=412755 RepID=A0A0F9NEC1_9ZZZZ